jgi:DeoR family transcriptional regulator, aga operon transcriptional repressor
VIDQSRAEPLQDGSRLTAEERRRKILDLLEVSGQVTVEELARQFTVSAVTARTDLDALEHLGALYRSHGGAIRAIGPGHDYPLQLKNILHHEQKAAIARAALQLVRPYQTLMFDSGTTTAEIARQLKEWPIRSVRIVTNSLGIAAELSQVREFRVVLIGGSVREVSQSCVGPEAERMLGGLRADHLFLAADGFDLETGPCTPDALEARLNGMMVEASEQVTVVADSSKFGRWSLPAIAPFESIRRVITDTGIAPAFASVLRARGVELITT